MGKKPVSVSILNFYGIYLCVTLRIFLIHVSWSDKQIDHDTKVMVFTSRNGNLFYEW